MERAPGGLRNAVSTAGLLARQAVLSLRYNWGVGIIAVVLAISFWVFVTDRESPERTGRVPGMVPVECVNDPPGLTVFPPCDASVSVRARARENVFENLTAEDFRAIADLSNVTGERATVSVRVESQESRAEVIDFSPDEITVTLEDVISRSVPVRTRLVGAPPRGFEVEAIVSQPQQAVVTGPESLVSRVDAVEADVNLTGESTNFGETLLLHARDAGGGSIQGVKVEPESVVVRANIIQLEFSAAFIVQPVVSGVPADGYNVTGIQVDPALVTISGPTEVFRSIDPAEGIMTETVPIDDASADVVRTVPLRLPPNAAVEQLGVTVRVSIAPAQGELSFTVVPGLMNAAPGLSATVAQPSVQVVLSGTVPDLSAVSAGDIVVTLDLQGLDVGEHSVPVRVQAPSRTALVSVAPVEVEVTLQSQ